MKKILFTLLFVSVLFLAGNANAVVSKIEKNALMKPTISNMKAYMKSVKGAKNNDRIKGLYGVNKNTAKIKVVRNIIALLKKHGYENNSILFRYAMQKRIKITKKVGFPIIIGIPEKKFKSKYKAGLINKNIFIVNESANIKPKAIALIHLLMKGGYNVGIATVSSKENKFWILKRISAPFITIIP